MMQNLVSRLESRLGTAVLLLALALGCNKKTSSQEPSPSATSAEEAQGKAATKSTSPLRGERLIVSLETSEGPTLGPDLRFVQRMLVVRDDPPSATFSQSRASGDQAGRPIGLFGLSLENEDIEAIRAAAKAAQWHGEPTPARGGPGISVMSLKVQVGDASHTADFSRMDVEAIARVSGLLDELGVVVGKAYENPKRALLVSVERGREPNHAFSLVLKNVGTEPFCVLDPRRLPAHGENDFATIRVAETTEETPGVTAAPLQWQAMPLIGLPDDKTKDPAPLTLAGGQELKFPTGEWKPKAGVEYIAQAVLSDYAGPVRSGDLPCIRGAVFSEGLEIPALNRSPR